ncbi:hypothetical protein P7K49_029316, partial [Saguinus oedipus]
RDEFQALPDAAFRTGCLLQWFHGSPASPAPVLQCDRVSDTTVLSWTTVNTCLSQS